MANQEQLEILKQGVEVWNKWRQDNSDLINVTPFITGVAEEVFKAKIDLSEANFSNTNLSMANLSGADLRGIDIRKTNVVGVDFRGANLTRANITGSNLYLAVRDYWKIENIRCDYVFWDWEGKERIPKDHDFRPGEFERLYKWRPLNDFERLIERSIEFPPEYKQAGVSILNYFSEILRKKYPESQATVQIKQDGLKVSMIIDTVKGEREIIEKTLNDYGLVITGQMPPEQFTDDKFLIYELKNELRIAQHRIESQRELLQITGQGYNQRIQSLEEQVCWLRNTVGTAIQSRQGNEQKTRGDTINIHAQDVNISKDSAKSIILKDSQSGVIGDNTEVEGGINFRNP